MPYDPQKHHRRSIRLRGYDYTTPGAYFITLCTYQRQHLFGAVVDGTMQLNSYGKIVAEEWLCSATIRQEIALDGWIVMPNHFHGIVIIQSVTPSSESMLNLIQVVEKQRKPKSLATLVAGFKMAVTTRINCERQSPGTPVWQRNYYECIIRDQSALERIRQYISSNPLHWKTDQLHPNNPSKR
jgi:putative transposase